MRKDTIIILHGWGLRGDIYHEFITLLENVGFIVFSLDLPGFGSEKLRKQPMDLDDYVKFVRDFMKKKKLKKVVLLGHSFGGRVAIKFTTSFPQRVCGLILTGAPGIRQRLSFIRRVVQYVAISLGELFRIDALRPLYLILRKGLYFMIGEWDYYKAGDLRETFKKIIAEDLASDLSKIKVPTLIVWGQQDAVVPLSVGRQMHSLIPHSKLVIVKDVGHKLPYENPKAFSNACLPFLEEVIPSKL